MPRVVAVSGHSGFVGGHLSQALQAAGFEVMPLSRSGDTLALPAAARVDAVVHLAFPTRAAERRRDPLGALRSAVGTTLSALAIAEASSASHFVLASSGKVYASPPNLPIDERHPVLPSTWLGELKLACEQMVRLAVQKSAGLGASVLRIFNVYGPRQSTDFVVPHLLSALGGHSIHVGELEHARDFIYIDDVCRAFVTALEHPPNPGTATVMNVGSGRSTTVRELAEMIETAAGERLDLVVDPARLRQGEPREECARCEALAALGFTATTTLEQGIVGMVRAPR